MKTKVTDYKTNRINNLTGGKISDYKIPNYPNDEGLLPNSFLTKNGYYIGDYSIGWWYVRKGMRVCDDYPCGVAEVHVDGKHVGYYGYTHSGGCTFKIGDRLFNEVYQPIKEDYEYEQWDAWENEFNEKRENGDDFDREFIYDNISAMIPFNMRGNIIIESMDQAKKAAINCSRYLS